MPKAITINLRENKEVNKNSAKNINFLVVNRIPIEDISLSSTHIHLRIIIIPITFFWNHKI